MLTVHQPKVFSRNLVVYDGDSPVGAINYRRFSDAATIEVGTATYEATRTGWFRSVYRLVKDGSILVTAEPVGFWQRSYEVRAGASVFTLRRKSGWFDLGWTLLDGDSVVGTLDRTGLFRARTVADFSDSVDLTMQLFVVWMANVLWQQDQSAAAAAAG